MNRNCLRSGWAFCAAFITSLGDLYYTIEGIDSGWPYPSFHPSYRKVMLP